MKKMKIFLATLFGSFAVVGSAFAQDVADNASTVGKYGLIAIGLCMALAAVFGTLSQSRAASAALEGIARNPQSADKVQTPMIIALALMESLVILSFIMCFLMLGKVGA